ncbi:MAG: response regulator [Acidobacteria bacterium]|nr:response regulator [Acidobacteriota bacterium]
MVQVSQADSIESLWRSTRSGCTLPSDAVCQLAAVGFVQISPGSRRFLSVNARACEISGYPIAELLTLPPQLLVHPEDRDSIFALYDRLERGEIPEFSAERRWVRKDGKVIWVSAITSLVSALDGRPLYALSIIEDITSRKEAELALRASQEQYLLIQAATGVATWEWEIERDHFTCSNDLLRLYGRNGEPGWRTYGGWLDRIHASDRPTVETALRSALDGACDCDIEHRVVWPDGSVHWLGCKCRVFRNRKGIVWRVIGVVLDITAHKMAQEQVARSGQRFRSVLEHLPAGAIYMLGSELQINRADEVMLGHSPEELDAVVQVFASAEQESVARNRRTAAITRKDGSERIVEFSGYTDEDVQVWLLHDVTAREQVKLELEKAKELAESASRSKSEFLANMSHEIRTPMNGVLGMTELLLAMELGPREREYVGVIKHSADALLTVINDILDFSKIEAGRLELDPVCFDLREAVFDAIKPLVPRAEEKGLEMLCRIDPDAPQYVVGDPVRLRQVFTNLVGNAIKFTPAGHIEVVAGVDSAEADGWRMSFRVSDTGIGIPPDKQRSIFDAFTQADASITRKYGGTGLGLSICSRLVRMMGGDLWLESEPGVGSMFQFTACFGVAPSKSSEHQRTNLEALRGKHVLVVDDNAINRQILHENLVHWGMIPHLACDVPAALEAIESARVAKQPFALVITDCHMPGQDGFALAEQMHADDGLRGIPAIMLTSGYPSDERYRTDRLAALLTKPVPAQVLLSTLIDVLLPHGEPAVPYARPESLVPAQSRLKVLLAEDNHVNQRVGKALLQKLGHSVDVVENGLQAFDRVQAGAYDVVFMDVQMPEMDGFAATKAIRAWEIGREKRVPIIAMTAHAMVGYKERCIEAGMDGYVSKPVSLAGIAEQLVHLAASPQR